MKTNRAFSVLRQQYILVKEMHKKSRMYWNILWICGVNMRPESLYSLTGFIFS